MNVPLLLGVGAAALVLLGLGVFLGLGAVARAERRQARLTSAAASYLPAGMVRVPRPTLRNRIIRSGVPARIGRFFGIDPDLRLRYPMPWFVVLLIGLALARLAAGMFATIFGSITILLTLLFWPILTRMIFARFHADHRAALFRQLPDALGLVVRATRVGIPATEAMRMVAKEAPQPTAEEFRRVADRLSIGMPFERALSETAMTNGVAEYRFFATAMSLQAQTGGGLSETLDNLADVIRKRVALRARGLALSSEARTSIYIMAALPFGAGGLISVLNPSYMAVLFNDSSGQKIMAVAAGMLLAGILVMQGTIRKSLS